MTPPPCDHESYILVNELTTMAQINLLYSYRILISLILPIDLTRESRIHILYGCLVDVNKTALSTLSILIYRATHGITYMMMVGWLIDS